MLPHMRYLNYVIRHKWFVFLAGRSLGVPLWQLLIHDWTKFLPSEWFPYVAYFYGPKRNDVGATGYYHGPGLDLAFDEAWLHHQKRNPHHWQYWVLMKDDGGVLPLEMPERFLREMVADWRGAGLAQGRPDTRAWYAANRDKMTLHRLTRGEVEMLLETPEAST